MDVLERKLIKLKRLIQSVQSSKLVRSDNTHSLVKGIKRLTDNMSETVHQLSIPILQDGRLPEKENMEELNEFK
ncbi:hypothetical protein [Pseudoalteromonas sp. SR45-5]|uniref:hypothetical protein n=1 Tax=Pseudoalteromonas sp. SR45-5 TaxID=2760928 RepID=UPI0015F7CAE0|nr:hypothetical protein [Pseudoalteromonas sp. SR45-5]MBB1353533.1 hypothetical protein [Pseudoalteromonas sp. SR45-5]